MREFGNHTLTREEIVRFASEFDSQPFHLDEAAAEASLFGALSASGWHTCALVMRMMCDDFLLDSASLGSPGLDHIKWLQPVLVGDTLRVRPHVGLVRFEWQAFNQKSEPVLTMQGWNMFGRREAAAPAA